MSTVEGVRSHRDLERAGTVRPMSFLLYQATTSDRLTHMLGEPDYSYYFVMREFRRVLERLGTVHIIEDPVKEVDARYDSLTQAGEDVLFLCFAPPHQCPVDLRCPTAAVVAWEFESIPDEQWNDDPRSDWRYVFGKHGRAITLSEHAAGLVKEAMGENFPVIAIPVPIWDRFAALREAPAIAPVRDGFELELTGLVLDGVELCGMDVRLPEVNAQPWTGDPLKLEFRDGVRSRALLDGFYSGESWGTWSRTAEPSITLPCMISSPVRIHLAARAYGANIDRPLRMSLGSSETMVAFGQHTRLFEVELHPREPANVIHFKGLDLTPVRGSFDPRTMGIGLTSLEVRRAEGGENVPVPAKRETTASVVRLRLDGVVYTSVLNPRDGRKNWEDLLAAFVLAFRENPDAVLILKMTHHDIFAYLNDLRAKLRQLAPFRCRVIIIHGFLDEPTYARLISATTYYANASRGEGLCIPLTEFMSSGRPGIAPLNTAMLDYLDDENGFPVRCWRVHNAWPPDTRYLYRTTWHRIDFESLLDAYRRSYVIARDEPEVYRAMSERAANVLERHSSDATVREKLAEFIHESMPFR